MEMDALAIIGTAIGVEVSPEEKLADLPMDSLDYLQVIIDLETASNKELPKDKMFEFKTVGELADFFTCENTLQ